MESTRNTAETDRDRIDRFNRTAHPFPDEATLHALFEAQVALCGSAIAVHCDHDKTFDTPVLTYAQLNAKANQLAHLLQAAGVVPGSIVGLLVERSFSMMIGLLGILKAGGAYLPIAAGQSAGAHPLPVAGCGCPRSARAEQNVGAGGVRGADHRSGAP